MTAIYMLLLFAGFGSLCFGGGYMLIALLMNYFVEVHHFFTMEQFGNLLSISQLTPGPVGINVATFVGYLNGGVVSSLAATLGLAIPSLTIGFAALYYFRKYRDNERVERVMTSVKAASAGTIIYAATIFLGVSVLSRPIPWGELLAGVVPENFSISISGVAIAAIAMILKLKTKLPAAAIIVGGAICGAGAYFIGL